LGSSRSLSARSLAAIDTYDRVDGSNAEYELSCVRIEPMEFSILVLEVLLLRFDLLYNFLIYFGRVSQSM
jgi:hypothetical protein